jgi:hypothetical protein
MALVTCKECNAQISSGAQVCPQCGYKRSKKTSGFTVLLGGTLLVIVLSVWLTPSTKSTAVLDPKKEADFQNVVRVLQWAKRNTKNPASFEVTYAGMSGSGTVCIEYRAANSFNAIVPEIYVMSNTVSGSTPKLWNDECAGRGLTDFTYARTAL